MSTVDVVSLQPADYATAGEILSRAFRDDPMWKATISDPQRVPETLEDMFTTVTKTSVAAGGRAETTPGVEAVSLWLPPGKKIGTWAIVRSGLSMVRFVMRMPPEDRKRMTAVLRQLEERKEVVMPGPSWYLVALGVDPAHQGKGWGSTLVRAGLLRADRENTSSYLETDTEANVAFYERLGFEVIERMIAEAIDVPVWLMKRPPPSRT